MRGGWQLHEFAGPLDRERAHVRQRLPLRVLGVAQQGGGRRVRDRQVLRIEAGQAGHAQLLAQLALAERRVELPRRALGERGARAAERCAQSSRHGVTVHQQLGGRQPRQPARQFALATFGQAEAPACNAQPGQAVVRAALHHGQQQGLSAFGQQLAVGYGAGRHHAHHLALDRPLARTDLAHLFGNGDRLAELHQLGQVGLNCMRRHARHHHRLARRLPARGERDVEQAVGAARVFEEQLVEVAHAVEQQRLRMQGLDAQVLRHHGRVGGERLGRLARRFGKGGHGRGGPGGVACGRQGLTQGGPLWPTLAGARGAGCARPIERRSHAPFARLKGGLVVASSSLSMKSLPGHYECSNLPTFARVP